MLTRNVWESPPDSFLLTCDYSICQILFRDCGIRSSDRSLYAASRVDAFEPLQRRATSLRWTTKTTDRCAL
jgi:hypothetical protein